MEKNCTSLDNMRLETIDQIVWLQEQCDCSVRVTGGTESGHTVKKGNPFNHRNGYKFDISQNPDVNSFIIDNCVVNDACLMDVRGDGAVRYTYNQGTHIVSYADEADAAGGSHWDVLVKPFPPKKTGKK